MKYDFKVGDYVETIDGDIGYISSICHCEQCKERGFYEPEITYIHKVTGQTDVDCITVYEANNGFVGYKRIGIYDFTKSKNSQKIEQLPYEKEYEVRGGSGNVLLKRIFTEVSLKDIIDKLNEVIDRVNEIGEKE